MSEHFPPQRGGVGGRTAPDHPPPASPASGRDEVTLAVIVGAHGVAGEVRLKLFAEGLDSIRAHKRFNDDALTLKTIRNGTNGAIAKFAEIADRSAAEALRGTELTVPRAALPPLADDEYYHADLIGLTAWTGEDEALGRVVAVENFGAGDVIEVERSSGKRFMVAMTAVTFQADRLVIDPAFIS